jgi:hypothetical protein
VATTDTARLNGLPVNPIYRGCLAKLSESLDEVNSVDIANTDSCFAEKGGDYSCWIQPDAIVGML